MAAFGPDAACGLVAALPARGPALQARIFALLAQELAHKPSFFFDGLFVRRGQDEAYTVALLGAEALPSCRVLSDAERGRVAVWRRRVTLLDPGGGDGARSVELTSTAGQPYLTVNQLLLGLAAFERGWAGHGAGASSGSVVQLLEGLVGVGRRPLGVGDDTSSPLVMVPSWGGQHKADGPGLTAGTLPVRREPSAAGPTTPIARVSRRAASPKVVSSAGVGVTAPAQVPESVALGRGRRKPRVEAAPPPPLAKRRAPESATRRRAGGRWPPAPSSSVAGGRARRTSQGVQRFEAEPAPAPSWLRAQHEQQLSFYHEAENLMRSGGSLMGD